LEFFQDLVLVIWNLARGEKIKKPARSQALSLLNRKWNGLINPVSLFPDKRRNDIFTVFKLP
jgi:hypothetical protein